PRLRQAERNRELALGHARVDAPVGERLLQKMNGACLAPRQERDVPLGAEPLESARNTERRGCRTVHRPADVAHIEQQRRPRAIRAWERSGEPRFRRGDRARAELVVHPLYVRQQIAEQKAIAPRQALKAGRAAQAPRPTARVRNDRAIADERAESASTRAAGGLPERAPPPPA